MNHRRNHGEHLIDGCLKIIVFCDFFHGFYKSFLTNHTQYLQSSRSSVKQYRRTIPKSTIPRTIIKCSLLKDSLHYDQCNNTHKKCIHTLVSFLRFYKYYITTINVCQYLTLTFFLIPRFHFQHS